MISENNFRVDNRSFGFSLKLDNVSKSFSQFLQFEITSSQISFQIS